MTTRRPSAWSSAERLRRRGLDRIGDAEQPGERARRSPTNITVWPSRRSSSARGAADRRGSTPRARRSAALPSATRRPSTCPSTPLPVTDSKLAHARGSATPASRAPATIAAASGCSLPRSRLAASREQLLLVEPPRRHDRREARLAFGERAGLVDDERVDLLAASRAPRRSATRTPACAPRPIADHDRHRRRETERAGTGDDEHRDGVDQGVGERAARDPRRPRRRRRSARRRAPRPARTTPTRDRRAAGSARGSAAPRRPSGRSARAACRCRRARPASRSCRCR